MNSKMAPFVPGAGVLILSFLLSAPLQAQVASASLSGTVSDRSGKTIASAKISVKNLTSGQSMEAQTDSAGLYKVSNLAPGDYEVSVSAEGFTTNVTRVTIAQEA